MLTVRKGEMHTQVTRTGVWVILRHRKALLQKLAAPLVPVITAELRMRDAVAGAGGALLDNIVEQLFRDDQGLCDTLDVLCKRAASTSTSCVLACVGHRMAPSTTLRAMLNCAASSFFAPLMTRDRMCRQGRAGGDAS